MNADDHFLPVSDELIQRLADGEMSDAARREILQRIDEEEPDRWRDLALALLEARLLAEAFREEEAAGKVIAPVSWQRRTLAIAAATLLGAFLAVALMPRTTKSPVAKEQPANPAAMPELSYRNVRVSGLDRSDLQIPVLQSGNEAIGATEALHAATASVRQMQQAFADRGLNPSVATSYVSADLEDGRRLVIPVSRLSTPGSPSPSKQ